MLYRKVKEKRRMREKPKREVQLHFFKGNTFPHPIAVCRADTIVPQML